MLPCIFPWIAWAGIGNLLLLALLLVLLRRRGRHHEKVDKYYSLCCGHEVEYPGAKCPSCGSQKSFEKME